MRRVQAESKCKVVVFVLLVLSLMSGAANATDKSPIVNLRSLSTELAHQVVAAAQAECDKRGYKVAASVVGRDGNLLALLRNPLAGPHSVEVSRQKAYTAATFQISTAALVNRSDLQFAPGVLVIVGGLPIEVGGHFYGAVAVSGAEPEIDEKCAAAGIRAIADTLEFLD